MDNRLTTAFRPQTAAGVMVSKTLTVEKPFKLKLKGEIKMASREQLKKKKNLTNMKGSCVHQSRLETNSAMAAGEISSRFSMLHSSRNSKMGDG